MSPSAPLLPARCGLRATQQRAQVGFAARLEGVTSILVLPAPLANCWASLDGLPPRRGFISSRAGISLMSFGAAFLLLFRRAVELERQGRREDVLDDGVLALGDASVLLLFLLLGRRRL